MGFSFLMFIVVAIAVMVEVWVSVLLWPKLHCYCPCCSCHDQGCCWSLLLWWLCWCLWLWSGLLRTLCYCNSGCCGGYQDSSFCHSQSYSQQSHLLAVPRICWQCCHGHYYDLSHSHRVGYHCQSHVCHCSYQNVHCHFPRPPSIYTTPTLRLKACEDHLHWSVCHKLLRCPPLAQIGFK